MTAATAEAAPATAAALVADRRTLPGAMLVSTATAASGVLTYAFLVLAARFLGPAAYGRIGVLWAAMFIAAIVLFRPLEQTASQAIAARRVRGAGVGDVIRSVSLAAAALFALAAAAAAVAWPVVERRLFGGSAFLTLLLVLGIGIYGASYVVRGIVGGLRWFGGYASILVADGAVRLVVALPLVVFASRDLAALAVVAAGVGGALAPIAWSRGRVGPVLRERGTGYPAGAAARFALPAAVIAAADQLIVNGPPLLVALDGASTREVGVVFAATMLLRAPVYVFQGLAASLLPNLTHLGARGDGPALLRALCRVGALLVVSGVSLVALTAAAGSSLMRVFYGGRFSAPTSALVLLAAAVSFYVVAATASQALLAAERTARAAAAWVTVAVVFALTFAVATGGELERVSVALAAATAVGAVVLTAALAAVLRR